MSAKAVLGLDASESSDRALAYAAALPRQYGTKQEKISAQVAGLRNSGLEVEPAHTPVESADRMGADVIITGSRGHTAITGMLVGSVARRLLQIAHCPLLVIPETAPHKASELARESPALAAG